MTAPAVELKNVVKRFDSPRGEKQVRAVDAVNLQIREGEFFALLGPSGCGKTTTLRLIAGFEQPTTGEVLVRGQPMQHVPPFHRPVNTVFQDYALFPHMSVLKNVLFGLEMAGISKAEAQQRAHEALELVHLPEAGNRKPQQLSGGQQQRVALARALVKRPAVLLLDEPLGALDLKLRRAMQYELKQMQQQVGITFIYVTHDQEEAMTMADRIAVMHQGRVLQVGQPGQIYEAPADRFVADFIGETNFIEGQLIAKNGEQHGTVQLDDATHISAILADDAPQQPSITVAIRPEKIQITHPDDTTTPHNGVSTRLPGRVLNAHYIGTDTRYTVRIGEATDIIVRMQNLSHRYETMFRVNDAVNVTWETANARILTH